MTPGRSAPVLFLMPHVAFGGAERLASRIAEHLAGLGHQVHVAVLGCKPGLEDAAAAWFAPFASIWRFEQTGFPLAERLAGLAVETGAATAAIIGLSPAFGALTEFRERQPDLRVVSFQFNEHELSAEHRVHAALIDTIIVEGGVVARTLAYLGVAEDRLAVIPSGPDLARLRADAAGDAMDALRPMLATAGPIVTFAGRMDPIKGPALFVEICDRLRKRPVAFVMAGDGPMAHEVQAAIGRRGLTGRIVWLGRVPHAAMAVLYRRSDLVVVPSLIDGRPLVVQEAQACGAAVVASGVGSIPDLVESGVTGWLCRPGDADDFARAVGTLLDDDALRRRVADGGCAAAQARGGLGASLDAYTEAILGRPARRAHQC